MLAFRICGNIFVLYGRHRAIRHHLWTPSRRSGWKGAHYTSERAFTASTSYPSCAFLCKEPASRRKTGLTGSLMCYGPNGRSGCIATERGSAVNAAPRRGAVAAGPAGTLPRLRPRVALEEGLRRRPAVREGIVAVIILVLRTEKGVGGMGLLRPGLRDAGGRSAGLRRRALHGLVRDSHYSTSSAATGTSDAATRSAKNSLLPRTSILTESPS